MIKIYVLATPAYHEDEEMVFKFAVYKNEKFLKSKTIYHEYRKPVLTGLYSILILLKEFPEFRKDDVQVIVHEGAMIEQLKGTTTTKNGNILKVAELVQKHLGKYSNKIEIVSVAGNHQEKLEWERMLNI